LAREATGDRPTSLRRSCAVPRSDRPVVRGESLCPRSILTRLPRPQGPCVSHAIPF
jgi:hypothetical protein